MTKFNILRAQIQGELFHNLSFTKIKKNTVVNKMIIKSPMNLQYLVISKMKPNAQHAHSGTFLLPQYIKVNVLHWLEDSLLQQKLLHYKIACITVSFNVIALCMLPNLNNVTHLSLRIILFCIF